MWLTALENIKAFISTCFSNISYYIQFFLNRGFRKFDVKNHTGVIYYKITYVKETIHVFIYA